MTIMATPYNNGTTSLISFQVSALQFFTDDYLLVGTGPYLRVYSVKTCQLLKEIKILPYERIHGIRLFYTRSSHPTNECLFTVFGGKSIRVIKLVSNSNDNLNDPITISYLSNHLSFTDWIKDVTLISDSTNNTNEPTIISLVFSHHFVEIYRIDINTPELLLNRIRRVQSEEKCLLYAASFLGSNGEEIVLATGTIFNQILVWRVSLKEDDDDINESGDIRVLKRLVGHDGVIFGISYDATHQRIISVSDDRSVRIWRLDIASFFNRHIEKQAITKPTITNHTCLYGHTARVWQSRVFDGMVLTVSEDLTCRAWDVETETCLMAWKGHEGRNAWCLDVSPSGKVLATGGTDSGVRLWSMDSVNNAKGTDSSEEQTFQTVAPTSTSTITTAPSFDTTTPPTIADAKYFTHLTLSKLLYRDTLGHFIIHNSTTNSFHILHRDPRHGVYALMESSSCGNIVVFGGFKGDLHILHLHDSLHSFIALPNEPSKINRIWVFGDLEKANSVNIIVSTLNETLKWINVTRDDNNSIKITHRRVFHTPKNATISSALFLETKNLLLCGTRGGGIVVFSLTDNNEIVESCFIERHIHGDEAVTGFASECLSQDEDVTFYTCGRDGCYAMWKLIPEEQEERFPWKLVPLRKVKITRGDLEKITICKGEIILMGFHRKRFFAYNESRKYQVMSIDCGGGHRRWDFRFEDPLLRFASFGFIRGNQLLTQKVNGEQGDLFSDSRVQNAFHGREVRAILFVDVERGVKSNEKGSRTPLLISGGEDCLFKIHEDHATRLHTHLSIKKHDCSIKTFTIDYKPTTNVLFTGGGREQLFGWKLEINPSGQSYPAYQVQCAVYAMAPLTSDDDMDCRVMSTDIIPCENEHVSLVAAVYSDSAVRVWALDLLKRKFTLLAETKYPQRCTLCVKSFSLPVPDTETATTNKQFIAVTTTDGRIIIWDVTTISNTMGSLKEPVDDSNDLTDLLSPSYELRVHQSGINCLDIHIHENHIYFISGGEDNAIHVNALQIDKTAWKFTHQASQLIPSSHGSTITGMRFFHTDNVHGRVMYFGSCSIDQRLSIWGMERNGNGELVVRFVKSEYLDIADVGEMDSIILKEDDDRLRIAVTGIGLQVFSFPKIQF